MHFSNRKALNNGVYAVMFPRSHWFQQNFEMTESTASPDRRPDHRTNLLVPVHGRFPVQKTDATLLGCLLSLLVELGTTQFETARRMADLVTPYNVMVRGPSKPIPDSAILLVSDILQAKELCRLQCSLENIGISLV